MLQPMKHKLYAKTIVAKFNVHHNFFATVSSTSSRDYSHFETFTSFKSFSHAQTLTALLF